MLPATPTFVTTNSVSASRQSPGPIQYIAIVDSAPDTRKAASIFIFIAAKSAIAPSSGATTATMTIAMVVAQAKRLVATASPSFSATTL
jgi:hypothetical protein